MTDITLCVNTKCPLKNRCLRFCSNPGYWQSWSRFTFDINDEGKASCNYYYPTASPEASARNEAPATSGVNDNG